MPPRRTPLPCGPTGRRWSPALLLLAAGCAVHPPPQLDAPPRSAVVVSGGTSHSMAYLARVQGGVIVVDLGWWGGEEALDRALRRLGATAEDVRAVFLTHSHRDHIGAWRVVRRSPFHMASAEVELFHGAEEHGGWIPRWAGRLKARDLPRPGELEVRAFSADTTFVFGADTLRAFLVPGHTPGSAAYLFRGHLFVGDAVSRTPWSGFQPARRGYSDDVRRARASLVSLRRRLAAHPVERLCSAHVKCAAATPALWRDLLGEP